MTNDITAGPELDAAVAKACGIEGSHDYECVYGENGHSDYQCANCGDEISHLPDRMDYRTPCVKPYSTDLNAAFEAAEKCGLFTYTTHLGSYSPEMVKYEGGCRWFVERSDQTQHGSDSEVLGRGETPALAICNAILALHGDK